jgi:hypothetical protein
MYKITVGVIVLRLFTLLLLMTGAISINKNQMIKERQNLKYGY